MSFTGRTMNILNLAPASIGTVRAFAEFIATHNLWKAVEENLRSNNCHEVVVSIEPVLSIQRLLRRKIAGGELNEDARLIAEMHCGPLPDPHTPGSPSNPGYPPPPGEPPPVQMPQTHGKEGELHLGGLEERVGRIDTMLLNLRDIDFNAELLKIIHRPGWTSIAELALVDTLLDAISAQLASVSEQCRNLLQAASYVGSAASSGQQKPEFGPTGLRNVVAALNREFSPLLVADWRLFTRDAFHLSPDQEKSLQAIPQEKATGIQAFFKEAASLIADGARLQARIVSLPAERKTQQAAHELRVAVEGQAPAPLIDIVIAHCDADCRNWGWGPAPKPK